MRHRTRRWLLAILLVAAIALIARFQSWFHFDDPHITVGWKNSVEESILAEILVQRIEHQLGPGVAVRHPLVGGTQGAHEALVVNEVDLCPEYAGSALVSDLRLPPTNDVQALREQVRENYRALYQIEWIGPLGFDASSVLVARKDFAAKLGAAKLSALEASPAGFRLAISRDFEQRDNGLPLLMRSYKLTLRGAPQLLDESQLYTALNNSQVDAISASVTDGALQSGNYVPLADDKRVFPPNEAGILVRSATLEQFPPLGGALRGLCGKIDSATIRQMNAAVVLNKRRPSDVAAQFLKSAGL